MEMIRDKNHKLRGVGNQLWLLPCGNQLQTWLDRVVGYLVGLMFGHGIMLSVAKFNY